MDQALTPAEVAKALKVSPDTVLGWIRSGQLRAYNVASQQVSRPRYRIDSDAIEEFKQLRQVIPPSPRRKKPKSNYLVNCF